MSKPLILIGLGWMTLFTLTNVRGQEVRFDAEFRPRTELRQGFRKLVPDSLTAAVITTQRTRFNTEYQSSSLKVRLTLQDARIWGNSNNKANTSKIEMYEGWFEWLISPEFSIKMGRQALRYDDQRLFASPVWSYTGTAHDVLLLKYEKNAASVHSGWAYNNSSDNLVNADYSYPNNQNYKALAYLWLSKPLNNSLTLSLIGVCDAFEDANDFSLLQTRMTYGGNLVLKNDSSRIGGIFTAYFQGGKDPHKVYNDDYSELSAFLLAIKMNYLFSSHLKAKIGCDYFSGSSADIESGKSNTFNRLYGASHSFNGSMEYFVRLPQHGLIDFYGGLEWTANKKLRAECIFHRFSFAEYFYYAGVLADNNIGSEMDVLLNYRATREVSVQFGLSKFFKTSSTAKYFNLNDVKLRPNHWAYLMITVKPALFKS
ncbi:alginate export family protein [Geofilum rubicundum]|uniref:Uncharacterized protein n=1 Tax=Geofilum rubicundum JCM 15548 TaxID=1236989 RepID=A0A0E9LSK3_9BACT|nr:alginate export family protein [Geofilum rubicundum]GAO28547.1 hypothetical protein JCM15548_1653 [Geofilum rubicundum JCM 15548]